MTDSHMPFGAILRTRKPFFVASATLLAALVMFLAWPTTTAQSPFWEVWIVDEAGKPVEGMTVTLTYRNYSAEREDHAEQKQTNGGGYVFFSPRNLRASRWRRMVETLRSAQSGAHASFGPSAGVMAYGNDLEGIDVNNGYAAAWTGAPPRMASRMVAKPRRWNLGTH